MLCMKTSIKKRNSLTLLLMGLPFFIILVMFSYVPIFGWVLSLFNYKPGIPLSQTPFTGLTYYIKIFQDWSNISRVLTNTFALAFLNILSAPLAVIFAILLNEVRRIKFKKIVQVTTTIPNFISWIIVYSMAFAVFSTEGLLNQILKSFGWVGSPTNLLARESATWLFQAGLSIWKSLGWTAIIYLAAITGIDQELYASAKVDGAGRFRCVLHVTLPGIMPTFAVMMLLTISNVLTVGFEQYFVFKNSVVLDRIEVLDLYLYNVGIVANQYSFATAIGVLKTFVNVTLLFSANFVLKKVRGEGLI